MKLSVRNLLFMEDIYSRCNFWFSFHVLECAWIYGWYVTYRYVVVTCVVALPPDVPCVTHMCFTLITALCNFGTLPLSLQFFPMLSLFIASHLLRDLQPLPTDVLPPFLPNYHSVMLFCDTSSYLSVLSNDEIKGISKGYIAPILI